MVHEGVCVVVRTNNRLPLANGMLAGGVLQRWLLGSTQGAEEGLSGEASSIASSVGCSATPNVHSRDRTWSAVYAIGREIRDMLDMA